MKTLIEQLRAEQARLQRVLDTTQQPAKRGRALSFRMKMVQRAANALEQAKAYQSSYEELTDEFCKMDQAILALSQTWTEHPKMPNGELWDGPCQCRECCSYEPAEDDDG